MEPERKPTALDAAFTVGLTLVLARAAAGTLGLPPVFGTIVAVGSVAVSVSGSGPQGLQDAASAIMAPANRVRLYLGGIELSPRLLGDTNHGTDEETG